MSEKFQIGQNVIVNTILGDVIRGTIVGDSSGSPLVSTSCGVFRFNSDRVKPFPEDLNEVLKEPETANYLTDHLAACKSELNETKAELEKCRAALRLAAETLKAKEFVYNRCPWCNWICNQNKPAQHVHSGNCKYEAAMLAIESCLVQTP